MGLFRWGIHAAGAVQVRPIVLVIQMVCLAPLLFLGAKVGANR